MAAPSRNPLPQILCSLWVLGFLAFFYSRSLVNNSEISRVDVVLLTLDNLPTLLNPFDFSHAASSGVDSGWHLLPQRWPFFRLAGVVLAAAMALGAAVGSPLLRSAPVTRLERFLMLAGLGLSLQSLWTLVTGCAGFLSPASVLAPGVMALLWLSVQWVIHRRSPTTHPAAAAPPTEPASKMMWVTTGLVALPFLILLVLNSCTPPRDFDVREYHLQGPKEWFLDGRISFLEHNVYTSFPFLSEMLSLNGMVLADDWNDGALAGKVILACFQLLTTLCVFATTRRWFGTPAALIAALTYLTVPWTLRISLIAYAEGAITFYLMVTVMSGLIASSVEDASVRRRLILLTGLLAGSAMASKYPGVVSVVIPVGLLLLWSRRRPVAQLPAIAMVFAAGVLLTVGPWLIRNTVNTGNPVYPLVYGVFGGADWSPDMDAKWKRGHSPSNHNPAEIPQHLLSVVSDSDWTSGLLFALAVPALLLCRGHVSSRWLWLMLVWMLVTWWLITHRIDRFWIPVIPVVAVLAGAAWTLFRGRLWHSLLIVCVVCCCLFNLQIWRSGLVGFQAGLLDMQAARSMAVRADFKSLHAALTSENRILMVGEAEVFDLTIPVAYNTVFDESLLEQWTADESDDRFWSAERRMKPPEDILRTFKEQGVTHVYVNWLEIKRYRSPGSYGYTEYVSPERLRQLVDNGVLQPPADLMLLLWEDLQLSDQELISSWPGADDLISEPRLNSRRSWSPIRLYKVSESAENSGADGRNRS